jgi:hypothetical protein
MTRKLFAALAAALLFGFLTPVWAAPARTIPFPDGGGAALVIPAASPLHLHGFNKDGWAQLDGTVTLSGVYHIGRDVYGQGDGGDDTLMLVFMPDRATKALLPHFNLPLSDIGWTIENADAFAAAILSKDQLAAVRKGSALRVSGKISIKVDQVTAWAICQNANFKARFVAVATPAQKFAAPAPDAPDC